MTRRLSDIERFRIRDTRTGESWLGHNQEWYRTPWQRLSGCGPTTASNIFRYLAPALPPDAARAARPGRTDALAFMEDVWETVTPTRCGIDTTQRFHTTAMAYAAAQGWPLDSRVCDIPPEQQQRPPRSTVYAFLDGALAQDLPVAFLNLCNGDEANLDEWHWVTIITLTRDDSGQTLLADVLDGGTVKRIDIGKWYATTTRGGGFVTLGTGTNHADVISFRGRCSRMQHPPAVKECREQSMRKGLRIRRLAVYGTLVAACTAAWGLPLQGRYGIDAAVARANIARAAAAAQAAGQPGAAVVPFVVPAMSGTKRLPDTFPADGTAFGPLRWVAARGEFEPASVVLLTGRDLPAVEVRAGDLVGPGGARIPAAAIDIKVVKVWYQGGSAWHGYFADALGRTLVPELLLHDEDLVRVDTRTRDNYVRYESDTGARRFAWMSAPFEVSDYTFANQGNQGLIADAPTLQPFALVPGEAKQLLATLRVPREAAPGLYEGTLELRQAGGAALATLPMQLRVLPFELPTPRTVRHLDREFYLCLYGTASRNPAILRNLADHNARHPMGFPYVEPMNPAGLAADVALAKETGIATRPIFAGAQGVGVTLYGREAETPAGQRKITALRDAIAKTRELALKHLGHTDIYSYGVDEGGPDTIRAERQAWHAVHEAGGKVMVTSFPHRQLLFDLDYLIIPGMPAPHRSGEVARFKEANPDALTGWYANPHSGPENPDYFRRLHGMMAYKAGYDVSANYCWWRNNWNDMAVPYEPNLRAIIMVYGARDGVIDTLAWEGVREGLDDVRYTTLLRQRATALLDNSRGAAAASMARRALAFLAYWDERREDINAYRAECIRLILDLETTTGGTR
ncbi:MAG: hypothetical protein GX174_07760 [Lentisphaerae bacterium]|jgi:hypothetical protein|nr:hypothetical protein [Lentisphaerota bacterium]